METITGAAFGMPLVAHIGSLNSHSAQRSQSWHCHEGYELIFILSGATAWEFQGGRKIEIAGGHFIVIPPKAVHRGERAMRKPSSMCGLLFQPQGKESWRNTTFTRRDLLWLAGRFAKSGHAVSSMSTELLVYVNSLVSMKQAYETDSQNPLIHANLRILACSVILEAASGLSHTDADAEPVGPDALMAAARKFLSLHLSEPVQMSALARHMGFSRSYLFALFKSSTGMTPNDYYLRLRVEAAQQMLTHSAQSITHIALETGFSSSQYFSSVFRKYTGQTPVEFRTRNRVA